MPQTPIVFALAIVFVFLILAAQYESWTLPFSVLLGTPIAVFGAFSALMVGKYDVDGMAVTLVTADADRVILEVGGVQRTWSVGRVDDALLVIDSPQGSVELRRVPRFPDPSAQLPSGALVAPMPGTVVRVGAQAGDKVTAGQPLVWLEAMKMEHAVHAPADGVLTSLPVVVGQQVTQGTALAVVGSA